MPAAAPTAVTLRLVARRGTSGGLGIDVGEANNVVGLSSGGQASSDGLLCVGDAIVAVDGEPLRGRKLSSVITPGRVPAHREAPRQGLPRNSPRSACRRRAAWRLRRTRAPRRRRPRPAPQRLLVTDVADTAAEDGVLRAGDVIVAVDGKAVGAGALGALVAPGQKTYEMLVLRREGAAAAPPAAGGGGGGGGRDRSRKIAALLSEATAARSASRPATATRNAASGRGDGRCEALVPASPSKAAPVVLLSDEAPRRRPPPHRRRRRIAEGVLPPATAAVASTTRAAGFGATSGTCPAV